MFNIRKIQHYVNLMQQRGFDPGAVLAGSGIRETQLHEQNLLVDVQSYQVVVANMLSLSGNEALGFEMGADITFTDMGIVGYAMMSATTIRDAMNLWYAYSQSLFGSVIDVNIQPIDDKRYYLLISELIPMGPVYRFCLEEFLLLCPYISLGLSGQSTQFSRIELTYPQPAHAQRYSEAFDCPLEFDAKQNRITVIWPELDAPIQSNNAELNEMYLRFCDQMANQLESSGPLAARLQSLFLKSPANLPSIGQAAKLMNCSERNLRRKLKHEGVTYRELTNQFRCRIAREYISTTSLSGSQIADLLGYQDSKPFLRAFKNWTGMTVGEYRQKISR